MTPDSKRWTVVLLTAVILIGSVAVGRRGIADPMVGQNGKVLIIEFSDYQCPACKGAEPVMRRLLDYYGDKVTYIHKNFPLEIQHKWARVGAIAAVCAERQGKFTAYHRLLYDRQPVWTAPEVQDASVFLQKYAEELGIDGKAFAACMKDPAANAKVTADYKEGESYNVRSTPTFFINGTRLAGSGQLSMKGTYLIDKDLTPADRAAVEKKPDAEKTPAKEPRQ